MFSYLSVIVLILLPKKPTDFFSQVGAKDVTKDTAQTLHLFNLLKGVAFVSVPFMANLPAVRGSPPSIRQF